MAALLFVVSDTSVEGLNPFRTVSSGERLKSFNEGVYIFEKNSVLGVGFNTYRYAQVRYSIRNQIGAAGSNADAGTDNSWLFVAATTGIVGLVFFCLSYFYLLKSFFPVFFAKGHL